MNELENSININKR